VIFTSLFTYKTSVRVCSVLSQHKLFPLAPSKENVILQSRPAAFWKWCLLLTASILKVSVCNKRRVTCHLPCVPKSNSQCWATHALVKYAKIIRIVQCVASSYARTTSELCILNSRVLQVRCYLSYYWPLYIFVQSSTLPNASPLSPIRTPDRIISPSGVCSFKEL